MRLFFFSFWFSFSFAQAAAIQLTSAQEKDLAEKIRAWWGAEAKFLESLQEGEVVSWADVQGADGQQALHGKVAGLHPRTCARGLRKISRYEDYHQHMSFVKESSYREKEQLVRYVLDHAILPFPMVLSFKIPRITRPGTTEFVFPNGIFAGLKGTIKVADVGERCIYFLETKWQGKSTGLPNLVVGAFAQTLTKIGLEHLIRISSL